MDRLKKFFLLGVLSYLLILFLEVNAFALNRAEPYLADADCLNFTGENKYVWQTMRKAVTKSEPYTHLVFVIDSSGSMKETDPDRVRINGLKLLMHKLNPEMKISVIDFDHRTKVLCENIPAGTGMEHIDFALEQVDAKGNTHMGKALEKAIGISEKSKGRGVIFLITDGRNNGKKDSIQIVNAAAGKIPIYTVGLSDQVNEQLLAHIAQITSGEYFKAKTARHLFEKLSAFFSEANREITLLAETGEIHRQETREFLPVVDPTVASLSVVLSWPGGRVHLEMERPDGTIVQSNGARAKFLNTDTSVIAMVNTRQSGTWKVRLTGVDVPSKGGRYRITVNGTSGLRPVLDIRASYPLGRLIPLRVCMDKSAATNLKLSAFVTDPNGTTAPVSHPGKFRPHAPGDYHVRLTLEGNLPDGQPFVRILQRDFHVAPRADKSLFLKEIGMVMRWIPPGSFVMGNDDGQPDERPAHPVVFTRGFWMAESEVTQAMWEKIMGNNPSVFKSGPNYPVENISFADCRAFLAKLNALTGLDLRLPTEAQWEYACRAGSTTRFWWGDDYGEDHVRCDEEWSLGPNAVKTFSPNNLGLYDMHSNVWEWCRDWYSPTFYEDRTMEDPVGPASSEYKVARGGAWSYGPAEMASSERTAVFPDRKLGNLGFRFVVIPKK